MFIAYDFRLLVAIVYFSPQPALIKIDFSVSNHVLSSRDKRLCFAEMIQIHVKMLQSFLDHNILDGADPPAPLQKEHVELMEDLWRVLGRIHKEKPTDTRTVSSKFEALHSELLT